MYVAAVLEHLEGERGPWQRPLEVRDGLDLSSSEFPTFQYALVLMRDWKTELPKLLSGDADDSSGGRPTEDGNIERPVTRPRA